MVAPPPRSYNSKERSVYFDPLIAAMFGAFGLAFGSFLNVCIYRLPRRILLLDERDMLAESDAVPADALERIEAELQVTRMWGTRSACPHCKQLIAWYDNVPVLSWLVLRGRCRRCKGAISARYIAVEVLTAALFIACYWQFGFSIVAAKFCALTFFLLGLVFTDAEWKLLPDTLTITGLMVGLAFSPFVPVNDLAARLLPGVIGTGAPQWRWASVAQSAMGAIIGAAFIYGAGVLYLRMRPDLVERGKAAMGLGDVKLMAMIGVFLGASLTIFTVFAASIAGALWGLLLVTIVALKRLRRHRLRRQPANRAWRSAVTAFRFFQVPFGVFLGSMGLIAAFFGNHVLRWYAGFFVY
jgi:leader peptidase (prepilin peptidase)/N-methyltransferase